MDNNVFIDLATAVVSTNIWKMIMLFMVAYISGSIVKGIASTIYEFIMIKTDIFGVGSVVEYEGKRGVIRSMGFRRIVIEVTGKHESIYIRTFDWPKLILVVPHDEGK